MCIRDRPFRAPDCRLPTAWQVRCSGRTKGSRSYPVCWRCNTCLLYTSIAFEDLTEEFGKSYKLFLIGKGYSASNTNHNLCRLQRLVYIAVDRGLQKFNPLEDVGYEKKGSPKRRHISRNDLLLIMETPMELSLIHIFGMRFSSL